MKLPLRIELRPSRRLKMLLVLVHVSAALCLFPLVMAQPAWAVMLVPIGVSLAYFLCRAGIESSGVLVLGANGELEINTKVGAGGTATLLAETLISPLMILLVLRTGERIVRLLLLPDSFRDDDFRRMSSWLRWQARPGVEQSAPWG